MLSPCVSLLSQIKYIQAVPNFDSDTGYGGLVGYGWCGTEGCLTPCFSSSDLIGWVNGYDIDGLSWDTVETGNFSANTTSPDSASSGAASLYSGADAVIINATNDPCQILGSNTATRSKVMIFEEYILIDYTVTFENTPCDRRPATATLTFNQCCNGSPGGSTGCIDCSNEATPDVFDLTVPDADSGAGCAGSGSGATVTARTISGTFALRGASAPSIASAVSGIIASVSSTAESLTTNYAGGWNESETCDDFAP